MRVYKEEMIREEEIMDFIKHTMENLLDNCLSESIIPDLNLYQTIGKCQVIAELSYEIGRVKNIYYNIAVQHLFDEGIAPKHPYVYLGILHEIEDLSLIRDLQLVLISSTVKAIDKKPISGSSLGYKRF